MSATLYIIDPRRHAIPEPRGLADFGAILEKWGGIEDAMNPAFVELARRLEAKFPPGRDGIWLSSPVQEATQLRTALWNLGLPGTEMLAVQRLVAQSAGELGLIAYDDQVGIGFLPGGRVVPEEMRESWEGSLAAVDSGEDIASESGVVSHVLPALQAVLGPVGFALQGKRDGESYYFVRTLDAIRQQISLRPMRYGEVEMHFGVYHEALKALWHTLHPETAYEMPAYFLDLGFFNPGPDLFPRWFVEHPRDLRTLTELMQRKVIPLANFCRDLHGLDQLLNDESADAIRSPKGRQLGKHRPPGSDGSLGIRDKRRSWSRLFIAHLAGNPRVAEIMAEVDKQFDHRDEQEYPRMKEALSGIAPLARWRDAAQHHATMRRIPATLLEHSRDPRATRLQHFEVGQLLEAAAAADPAAFMATYAADDGVEKLVRLWDEHGLTLPAEDRLDAAGIGREPRSLPASHGPVEVLLVRLPAALKVGEVAFVAVARRRDVLLAYTFRNELALRDGRLVPKFVHTHAGTTSTREHNRPATLDEFLAYIAESFPVPAAA
jgi:hypothetical protein